MKVYRSSVTGRGVHKSYATKHPDITVAETASWLKVVAHRLTTVTKPRA